MRRIYRTIVHIVARAGTILLIGESGTGKAIKGVIRRLIEPRGFGFSCAADTMLRELRQRRLEIASRWREKLGCGQFARHDI